MKCTGARILIESLIAQGVDTIFGYPGASVLNIYDELYRYRKKIRHILVSHEQHAAHAADGYARSTGRAGVCLATSGPGATNLVTGIATAFVDSVPLVAITGNVSLSLLGKDSFQEVDIAGITMPIVKHNWIAEDVRDLAEIVREAFIVALAGRQGPVLIDIPKDVTGALCEFSARNEESEIIGAEYGINNRAKRFIKKTKIETYNSDDINKAAALINESKRPMIYAGGGVIRSDAFAELRKFAELLRAPVALSLMGMGAIPSDHHLYTGLIGMYGTTASIKAAQNCDLLIAAGARFSDRVTNSITGNNEKYFFKNAKIIHIDIDPAEINKNIYTDSFIIGDIKVVLNKLIEKIHERSENERDKDIQKWKEETAEDHQYKNDLNKKNLTPHFIIKETAKTLGDNTIVVTDVGQHQIWTAQYYPFKKPRSFLSSGGMGTMGFGMGAASGAKIANPKTPVVLFTGDGCFRMDCAELATMVKYDLPVLIIIFNNKTLGMLRQWQNIYYKSNYYETDLDSRSPDFIKLAEAYGVRGFRVTDEKSFTEALEKTKEFLAAGKPAVIEAVIDKDEKVKMPVS